MTSQTQDSNKRTMVKKVSQLGISCLIGSIIGYCAHKYLSPNKESKTLKQDSKVMKYIETQGNVKVSGFNDIRIQTKIKYPKEAENITPMDQLFFLKWLVSTLKVRRAIQVGVFTGSSALAIALGMKLVYETDLREYEILLEKYNSNEDTKINNNNLNISLPQEPNINDYKLIAIDCDPKLANEIKKQKQLKSKKDFNSVNLSFNNKLDDDSILNNNPKVINARGDEYGTLASNIWNKYNVSNFIELRLEGGTNVLTQLASESKNLNSLNSYDFAFVNADQKNYQTFYSLLKDYLIKKNGIIIFDHVLLNGKVCEKMSNSPKDINVTDDLLLDDNDNNKNKKINISSMISDFNAKLLSEAGNTINSGGSGGGNNGNPPSGLDSWRKDQNSTHIDMAMIAMNDGMTFIRKL